MPNDECITSPTCRSAPKSDPASPYLNTGNSLRRPTHSWRRLSLHVEAPYDPTHWVPSPLALPSLADTVGRRTKGTGLVWTTADMAAQRPETSHASLLTVTTGRMAGSLGQWTGSPPLSPTYPGGSPYHGGGGGGSRHHAGATIGMSLPVLGRSLSAQRLPTPDPGTALNGSLSLYRTAKITGRLSPERHNRATVLAPVDIAKRVFSSQPIQVGHYLCKHTYPCHTIGLYWLLS
jgi:hypothetical protein